MALNLEFQAPSGKLVLPFTFGNLAFSIQHEFMKRQCVQSSFFATAQYQALFKAPSLCRDMKGSQSLKLSMHSCRFPSSHGFMSSPSLVHQQFPVDENFDYRTPKCEWKAMLVLYTGNLLKTMKKSTVRFLWYV